MAKKKTQCPYCGNLFVSLSRHKCKLAPVSSDEKAKPSKSNSTANSDKISSKKKRNYSEIDKEVLNYVKNHDDVYKDEIAKALKIDEKLLVNSITRLKNKQKIQIKSDLVEGIRRELIQYIEEYKLKGNCSDTKTGNGINWETMGNCPCFLCPNVTKCNFGQNETNPIHCQYLVDWINCRLYNTHYETPFKGNIQDKKK
jgi:hypothetical protein